MKVNVKDLGILKQAEFEVGDLTIICGTNNTGKTYATYALYGFLEFWNEFYTYDYLSRDDYEKLMEKGSILVSLDDINSIVHRNIDNACKEYTQDLPMVFGASKKYFANSEFSVQLGDVDFTELDGEVQTKDLRGKTFCDIMKVRGNTYVTINLTANAKEIREISEEWLLQQINRDIQELLFSSIFAVPFIASIERTGATTFQKELDFSRNRLIEHVSNPEIDINPLTLIRAYYDGGYALPVKDNVDFIRKLENVAKNDSVIAQENPDILEMLDKLAGGTYKIGKEGVSYVPSKGRAVLKMGESASSVRALLNFAMYIQHIAKPGDFLMIDEPELNLHPKNQRLMARLLAKLANAGVRVYITTHSDYILKEFNTLIMMKNAGSRANSIMEKYNYCENELLDSRKIKAYIAKIEKKHNTFSKAPIDIQGIEIVDFDETIEIMNRIQDELLLEGM